MWQSSHIGGDRFAGNVVFLPEGLYYGRVEPAEADLPGEPGTQAAGPGPASVSARSSLSTTNADFSG